MKIVYEPNNYRVAAYDGSKNIGESTYSDASNLWIIDHTFVDDDYRGKGIAQSLVAEFVKQARKHNVKIIPLCPFAKKEFQEKPEYSDVLNK